MPVFDQRGSVVMDRPECIARLAAAARRVVGRVAVEVPGASEAPYVVPVDFSFVDRSVIVRTGPGMVADHLDGRLVAFEVDDVSTDADGVRHGWSVLVRGLARALPDEAVAALGAMVPNASVAVPGTTLFAIRPDVVTGRMLALGGRLS